RAQHRACPRFSIQAQVRALCQLHAVRLLSSISRTMSILYGVDDLVNTALRHDTPEWRMQHACAPCLYVLEGEEPLKPALLATMDGNQSLKLVDDAYCAGITRYDPRTARTDMWLHPDDVNRFQNEVQDN
ncbi:hypothetical protein DAEQUDRAFT_650722, partial [Daedalea quercina L-15889]